MASSVYKFSPEMEEGNIPTLDGVEQDVGAGKSDEEKADVFECWETFINEYRKHKEKNTEKNWLNDDVYMELSDGHRRNCKKEDFEARLSAVKAWWSNYSE